MSEERFKIEDNIPLPPRYNKDVPSNAGLTDALRRMEVGQSVFVPNVKSQTVSGFLAFLRRTTTLKFTQRKQGDGVRIWRLS